MPGTRSDRKPSKSSAAHFLSSIHPSFFSLYSLQGEWNSEAGRGVQCVVSKFRMYFRALERGNKEKKKDSRDGGGIENERCGRAMNKKCRT